MYQHFRLKAFLVGIVAGLFIVFVYQPAAVVVYEYPHPQNVGARVYRDKNGVCYAYKANKVECDANEATLRPYPLQG